MAPERCPAQFEVDRVWRHGRRYGRDELLVNATGRKLDPAPYLRHLSDRYIRPN